MHIIGDRHAEDAYFEAARRADTNPLMHIITTATKDEEAQIEVDKQATAGPFSIGPGQWQGIVKEESEEETKELTPA